MNTNNKRSRGPQTSSQAEESSATAAISDADKKRRLEEAFKRRKDRSEEIGGAITVAWEDKDPLDLLDDLALRWELHTTHDTMDGFVRLAMKNFKVDEDGNTDIDLDRKGEFGMRQLDEEIERHEQEAIKLFNTIKLKDPGGVDVDSQLRAAKVIEMVYYGKRVVLSAFQARLAVHQMHSEGIVLDEDLDMLLGSWTLRYRWINMTKSTALQKLLLHLLDYAMEKRYRKHNGMVYEPIVVDGYETHAWRHVCEIKEFVYAATQKEMHWEQWEHLTASGNNARMAIDHISHSNDYQFRFLVKDRSVFAFRNGVYLARDDRFHRFAPDAEPLADSIVAAKFFDTEFDTFDQHEDWRDIPTPNLQRIMDFQEWPADVCDWMYVMLGRMLYNVGELDGWQVIPFLHGSASSGKCMEADTPVLMHDGSVRPVQYVGVGDLVMGDDGSPRRVLSLARGIDDMATIRPRCPGLEALTVTTDHVLCLKHPHWLGKGRIGRYLAGDEVFEMTVREYTDLPADVKRQLVCYRVPVDFGADVPDVLDAWETGESVYELPHEIKTGSRRTRMEALAGMIDSAGCPDRDAGAYVIKVRPEQVADDLMFVARSLGFGATKIRRPRDYLFRVTVFGAGVEDIPVRTTTKKVRAPAAEVADARHWDFDVEPVGRQVYYGFETDGNQRFVLGDFTCTHNSTITLKVAKLFYDDADVGVLSNNIERQFGLSAFHDKLIFVGPEIKSDLRVEQAEFQGIVSGETVQIAAKHKKAISTEWKPPGMLAGNEVPMFSDNAGSVQRRLLVFSFLRAVLNGDMKLADKLATELAAILAKCNRAYLDASQKYGSRNIWTVLPNYFQKTRDEMAQAVNSIEAFLASAEVKREAGAFCPLRVFKDLWKAFAVRNGYRINNIQESHFRQPFDKFGLVLEKGTVREYNGKRGSRDWVVGMDVVAEDSGSFALG